MGRRVICNPKYIRIYGTDGSRQALVNNKKDYFRVDVSSPALRSFSSQYLGKAGNKSLFMAEAKFEILLNMYTVLQWEHISHETVSPTYEWIRYQTYQINALGAYKWDSPVVGNIAWNSYDLYWPGAKLASYHDLELELGYELPQSVYLYEPSTGEQYSINFQANAWRLAQVRGLDSQTKTLETYKDTILPTNLVNVNLWDFGSGANRGSSNVPPTSADTSKLAAAKVLEEGVGVFATPVASDAGLWPVEQQSLAHAITDGSVIIGAGNSPSQNTKALVNLNVQLQPEVRKAVQTITIKPGQMDVRTQTPIYIDNGLNKVTWFVGYDSAGNIQRSYNRNVGIRVNNQVIQQRLEVTFEFFSFAELRGVKEEAFLALPSFQRGDMVWDTTLLGNTGATMAYLDSYDLGDAAQDSNVVAGMAQQWITIILGAAIAVVGLYFFVKIIPGLSARINSKGAS